MGMSGVSKSQVSRLCEEIDGKVKAFHGALLPTGRSCEDLASALAPPTQRLRFLVALKPVCNRRRSPLAARRSTAFPVGGC